MLARRTSRLDRRLAGITRGSDGSLESILDSHLDKVYDVSHELDELSAKTAVLEATQRRALQRTGLVRFNPFEDTGGNQSFALAILDALYTEFRDPNYAAVPALRRMVSAGQLGRKSGRGFYDYSKK